MPGIKSRLFQLGQNKRNVLQQNLLLCGESLHRPCQGRLGWFRICRFESKERKHGTSEPGSSLGVKGLEQALTALDGVGGDLEGDVLSSGLRNVHTEHQANTRVLPAHVRLALPQLDVCVPELQDPDTVDSGRGGARTCEGTTLP